MRIIVDAMGGDNAPLAPVQGALQAVKEYGVEVVLVGRGEEILKALRSEGVDGLPKGLSITHADQVVEMCDNPATAFKEKKDSSLTVGLNMVKNGEGDAFVSAGSTGALLAGATLLVKRIKGIRRAAMAPVVPTGGGGAVLVDCGATAGGTPEFLLQFAFMGSYYAERVLGRPEPKVGLLNIGGEPSKGTDLQREAYALLKQAGEEGRINFVGNVEAREAVEGAVDVIVADGYSGNIFLKTMEGTGLFLARKKLLDSNEVGGTALVGIARPVIKAHGSSNGTAMKNAIRQAVEFTRSGMIEDITENVGYMRLPVKPVEKGGE